MSKLPIIKFQNVSVSFQAQDSLVSVLNDVNFEIASNSFSIIYGPSGSGKTTVLNMLLGMLPPTKGKVLVGGVDIYAMNQDERSKFRAKHFGMVYQTNNWITSLTVLENIALPLYLGGANYEAALKDAMNSLKRVGLDEYAHYRPSVLSIGQQQRISMARATIVTPELLVADEPTGNLDSKNGDMIMQLIASFKNNNNSTIVLVTHNLDYLPLSDHRLFIKDGVVTQDTGGYLPESVEKLVTAVDGKGLRK